MTVRDLGSEHHPEHQQQQHRPEAVADNGAVRGGVGRRARAGDGAPAPAPAPATATDRRWRVGSIRLRALVLFAAVFTGLFVVNLIVVQRFLSARLDDRIEEGFDTELAAWESFVAANRPDDPTSPEELSRLIDDHVRLRTPDNEAILVGIVGGQLVAVESTLGGAVPAAEEVVSLTEDEDRLSGIINWFGTDYRWSAVGVGDGLGAFVVVVDLTAKRAELAGIMRIVAIVSGLCCLLGALLALALMGRVLEPLRRTSEAARSINDAKQSARVPITSGDELGDLCGTINGMLDRLDAAFAARRDFIDDLGHELRTPLTIVRGHLDVFPDNPVEQQETLELCRDELDRMGRDVECLALVAKSRQPTFLVRRPVDLAELVDEAVQRAQLLQRQHVITVDRIAEGLAWCDPDRICQALDNLIANACKYSAAGTRVTISSERAAGTIRFQVADQGLGIDVADQQRIFERFARGNGPAARREGTGLGLAIVRAVAEAHGGAVGVDSRPAAGSRFWFTVSDAEMPGDGPSAVELWGMVDHLEVGRV